MFMGWRIEQSRWLTPLQRAQNFQELSGSLFISVSLFLLAGGFNLHELPAETPFDAKIAVSHAVVERRSHAHDLAVLLVHGEVAAHAAVRADSVGLGLPAFVPCARLAHIIFALEHQRAGGTDADTVAAIDAGRIGQRNIELGGDMRGEAAAGDGDRESVLRVHSAGFHALVTKNALGVIADVKIVIDLDRLRTVASASPKRSGCASYRCMYSCIAGAVETSTEEARNSSTNRRLSRTRSESVLIDMPGSTLREQAGTSVRDPSNSTTQTRQTLTGVRLSRKHSVGVSIPSLLAASRMVEPSGTETFFAIDLDFNGAARGLRRRLRHRAARYGNRGRRARSIGPRVCLERDRSLMTKRLQRLQRRFQRARGSLAQAANRGVAHGLRHLPQHRNFLCDSNRAAFFDQPLERFLLTH